MTIEILYAIAFFTTIWMLSRTKRDIDSFLIDTVRIEDAAAFNRFKKLARKNMRMALIQYLMLIPWVIAGINLIRRHGGIGYLSVIGANVVIFFYARLITRLEKRARNLDVAEEMAEEYRRIGEVWVKKALPDF